MRPVTALFADIVGSTRLGEHLAPDEVKLLVGECVGHMSRAVEQFGGVVQAYMGDGICAYFGVPVAHGDDAERAARASLRILQAIEDQRRDIELAWGVSELNVRVGINSGPAAVGLVGGAAPQEVALGDATNVAARLQASAEPGTVMVGPVTARQLSDRFALEPLGELKVKGREVPVDVWRLLELRTSAGSGSPTPFVGRRPEIVTLHRLAKDLQAGRGQVLLISAESGMGKSRLLAEFQTALGTEITWLQGQCLPYGGELPYGPFAEVLRSWLGVERAEPEISARTKLLARMRTLPIGSSPEQVAFLGRLLCVKTDPALEEKWANHTPEKFAHLLRSAYLKWVEDLTGRAPAVLALEDLHSADATTRALAEELVPLTDTSPLCVVATLEPKASSEVWPFRVRLLTEYAHRTNELVVPPLADDEGMELVDLLAPAGTLEPKLASEIVDRAEGNPLYLKELLRAVLEGGSVARNSTWTVAADLPPALESLLLARVDRLPRQARRAAQIAAIIGRDFSYDLLQKASDAAELPGLMATLLRAEIVRELRRYPSLEYTFTSLLLHETVLSTLPPARMKPLYRKVARLLEEESAIRAEDNPAKLAFYYYRSDEPAKAVHFLEQAAAQAEGVDSLAQAYEFRTRALKAAKKTSDEDAILRAKSALLSMTEPRDS